jgi:GT2 family glycosyltransferase
MERSTSQAPDMVHFRPIYPKEESLPTLAAHDYPTDTRVGLPAITLVIASCQRPEALKILLSSVRTQTLDPSLFEVSVVVDGIDDTEAQYRDVLERTRHESRFQLRYEFQANAGPSTARHRAIMTATTPWICVVDDDMRLSPGFICEHLKVLWAGSNMTVAIGRVLPETGWKKAPAYEALRIKAMLELHEDLAQGSETHGGHAFVTQNVAFSKAIYVEVGGFDRRLRLAEDTELGLRLEFAGAHFVFADKASAVHYLRIGSFREWLRRCTQYGHNATYIYSKLDRDLRAHPLRNLVNGSRLNAAAVHSVCWSESLSKAAIATLRRAGESMKRIGLVQCAIASHKAILAIAYHQGVTQAWGSWKTVVQAKRVFAKAREAPRYPT